MKEGSHTEHDLGGNFTIRYAFVYEFTVLPGLVLLSGTCPRLAYKLNTALEGTSVEGDV